MNFNYLFVQKTKNNLFKRLLGDNWGCLNINKVLKCFFLEVTIDCGSNRKRFSLRKDTLTLMGEMSKCLHHEHSLKCFQKTKTRNSTFTKENYKLYNIHTMEDYARVKTKKLESHERSMKNFKI